MAYNYTKGLPGAFRGSGAGASEYLNQYVLPGIPGADTRLNQRRSAYDSALNNPTGTADMFGDYFQTAANAYAAPAIHDFNQNLAGVRSNTASRFGGNASSSELKNIYNTSDLFTRNLSNAIAQLAPQAAGMGLQYTNMLGGAEQQANTERQGLTNDVLQGISMYGAPQPKKGSLLGGLVGAGLGFLKGGPVGAIAGGYSGYGG